MSPLATQLRDGAYFNPLLGGGVGQAPAHLYEGQLSCASVSHGADCTSVDPTVAATGLTPANYTYRVDILASTVSGSGFASFYIADADDHAVHYVQLLPLNVGGPTTGSFAIGSGHGPNMVAILALAHNDTADQAITISFSVDVAP